MLWWTAPAVAGVFGLMFLFAGLGKLMRLKAVAGLSRLCFGSGLMAGAFLITFAGLNLQTYKRLTYEQPVATISFTGTDDPQVFEANLIYPGGDVDNFTLRGDEWDLNARIIKFESFSNLLGYNSVYRLDRLYGRYEDVDRARETNGVRLSEDPGLAVFDLAIENGGSFGVRDASYGSAVYNPMADGLSYAVSMGQTGLIARPANEKTRNRLGEFVEAPDTVSSSIEATRKSESN